MTSDRFDELLAGLLNGDSAPAEIQELLDDAATHPESGRRLVELLRLEPLLIDYAQGDHQGDGFVRRVQQAMRLDGTQQFTEAVLKQLHRRDQVVTSRRKKQVWVTVTLFALAAILLTLGILLWPPSPEPAPELTGTARLKLAAGEAYVLTNGVRTSAVPGQSLAVGQEIRTGSDESLAEVEFSDGTCLKLDSNTCIRLDADDMREASAGRRVFVTEGVILATIARQQAGRPMVIATRLAEVFVKKTRFSLANASDGMHISLESGVVEVKRKRDGKSIRLESGQYALVANEDHSFAPQQQPPRLQAPVVRFPGHADQVRSLAWTPHGNLLASASFDGFTKLWSVEEKALRETFRNEAERCHFVCFSPNGHMLATVVSPKQGKRTDAVVRLWNLQTGQETGSFPAVTGTLPIVAFSADSKVLATVDENRNIQLWDIAEKRLQQMLRMRKGRILSLQFSKDGNQLHAMNEYGTLMTWEIRSGQILSSRELQSYESEKECAAFSTTAQLVATGSKGATVQVWEAATGKLLASLRGHRGQVLSVAFSPSGELLASGSRDQTARVWDIAAARELATCDTHSYVRSLCFAADGNTLVIDGAGGTVNLWNIDSFAGSFRK